MENTGQSVENPYRNAVKKMAASKLFLIAVILTSVLIFSYLFFSIADKNLHIVTYIIPLILLIAGLWLFSTSAYKSRITIN